ALLPGVVVADDEDEDEDEHLDQAEQQQLIEDDGPREHEDRLDVEDDEQHRDQVVADTVPVARVGCRFDAAFVGLQLHLVVLARVNQAREYEGKDGKTRSDDKEDGDRNVGCHWRQGNGTCGSLEKRLVYNTQAQGWSRKRTRPHTLPQVSDFKQLPSF